MQRYQRVKLPLDRAIILQASVGCIVRGKLSVHFLALVSLALRFNFMPHTQSTLDVAAFHETDNLCCFEVSEFRLKLHLRTCFSFKFNLIYQLNEPIYSLF
jgi:hypothetical protein